METRAFEVATQKGFVDPYHIPGPTSPDYSLLADILAHPSEVQMIVITLCCLIALILSARYFVKYHLIARRTREFVKSNRKRAH